MPGNDMTSFSSPLAGFGAATLVMPGQLAPLVDTTGDGDCCDGISIIPVEYRFRGWNVALKQYEVWFGTSKETPNPSGASLVEVTIEAIPIPTTLTSCCDTGTTTTVSGPSFDAGASYVVLNATGSLNNERVLTPGSGFKFFDAGAGGNYTLSVDDNVVATLSGSRFSGPIVALGGVTGSIHTLPSGISYILGEGGVSVRTGSNGQVIISGSAGSGGGSSGGLGFDPNPSYLVLGVTSSLNNERVLNPTTGLKSTDGGANGNFTVFVDDNVVATLSGSTFRGGITALGGVTGSIHTIPSGLSYLVGAGSVTITTSSNGQVVISGSGGSVTTTLSTSSLSASVYNGYSTGSLAWSSTTWADFLAIPGNFTDTLQNGIIRSGSTWTVSTDGFYSWHSKFAGFGSSNYLGFRLSGSNGTLLQQTAFANSDEHPATLAGIIQLTSGSSFKLQYCVKGGTPSTFNVSDPINGENMRTGEVSMFLVAGLAGAGSIAGSSSGLSFDPNPSYLVLGTTASLNNERVLVTSTGIKSTDGGANGNFTVTIDDSVVATLTGSDFSGPVVARGGVTGSIHTIPSGLSYLVGAGSVTVTTATNGQVVISGSGGSGAGFTGTSFDPNPSYLVLGTTSSLNNERVLTTGAGLKSTDGGANGNFTVVIDDNVVATLSGSTFRGGVTTLGGVTGSIHTLPSGLSYLAGAGSVTVTTASNGQVVISGSGPTGPGFDSAATYLVLNTTSSLDNERAFVTGSGLKSTDGGAGGNFTVTIDDNIVATVSGSTFRGGITTLGGVTGSIHTMPTGQSYIAGGGIVTVTTASTGQVLVTGAKQSTIGAFASRPSAGNSGARYLTTDAAVEYVDDGSTWRPIIAGRIGTEPPVAATFTLVQASGLTNAATLTKTTGCLEFTWVAQGSAGAAQPERLAYKSAPSSGATGYRVTAHYRIIPPIQSGGTYSFLPFIGYRLSTNGSVEFFEWCLTSSGTVTPQRRRYTVSSTGTAPTFTFSAQTILSTDSTLTHDIWLRTVRLTTGVRKFYVSSDGIYWKKLSGIDTTANEFITPDQIIWGCAIFGDTNTNTEVISGVILDSWEEEAI